MEPTDRQPDDDALDEALRDARWPEPDAASTRRLMEAWSRVSPARAWWRIGTPAVAAAAMLVTGIAVAAVLAMRGIDAPRELANTRPVLVPPVHVEPQTSPAPWTIPVLHDAPRAPNAWERAAMLADRRRSAMAAPAAAATAPSPAGPLLAALSDRRMAARVAAARELGQLNDPSVTAELVARVERGGVGRREALAALLCSGSPEAAAYVNAARASSALRSTVRSVEVQLAHY